MGLQGILVVLGIDTLAMVACIVEDGNYNNYFLSTVAWARTVWYPCDFEKEQCRLSEWTWNSTEQNKQRDGKLMNFNRRGEEKAFREIPSMQELQGKASVDSWTESPTRRGYRSGYSRLQLRWFRVPRLWRTFGLSKTTYRPPWWIPRMLFFRFGGGGAEPS